MFTRWSKHEANVFNIHVHEVYFRNSEMFFSPRESDSLRSGLKFYPWCFFYLLVRPKTIVFGRTYVLRMMFFFILFLFFSTCEISEKRGPTGVKFCTMVSTRPNFIMPVQNFLGGCTPKKIQGQKTCKIWPDFGRLRSSATNISETDEDIQKKQVRWSLVQWPWRFKCEIVPP